MKKIYTFENTPTGRITAIAAQRMLVLASLLFFLATTTVHAAEVIAVDPQFGVKGPTVVVEGTSWGFNLNTVTTVDSGNNRIATINNPTEPTGAGRDHNLSANPGTLDTTIYRYVQVFYSLASDFTGSYHQLRLQTTEQSAAFVTFNSSTSIPSTAGNHSIIIDLLDGSTSLGGDGYSGNLTLLRWDFWNDNIADNDGKSMTLDRIVFASELVPEPDKIDTVLLFDNFNTSNGSATLDLATRQTGTMAPESYDAGNIVSGLLSVGGICQADFTPHIKNTEVNGFKLSFDAAYTGDATYWSSPYLSTHPGDERANSEFGLLIFENGTITAYGTANKSVSPAALTTLLGSWDVTAMNNYSLVTTPETATTGTYDVFINGKEAISDVAYTIGTGGDNGEINWQVTNISGGKANYDNLYASTFIIPPAGTILIIK